MKRSYRILVPVDFSPFSREALKAALDLARHYEARIDVLHVLAESSFPSLYGAGALLLYGEKPDLEHDARVAMKALIDEVRPSNFRMNAHIVKGDAADGIIEYANEQRPDLIVIPTQGLTGLEHALLGSVAERVVREAPCPVYIVKPLAYATPESEPAHVAHPT
jgi:nucleotide-binding universal stress UspA family protein